MRLNLIPAFSKQLDVTRPLSRLCAAATLGLCLSLGASAYAQQTYTLDDEGWQQLEEADPESAAGQLQIARTALAEGDYERAVELTDRWVEQRPNHVLLPKAFLIRGDAKTAAGDYYQALFDYEYLIRAYPSSPEFHTALEREYEIAKLFATGTKRKLWGMRIVPAGGEAEELFIRIQERAPGSELGERASLALGDYYYRTGDMPMAAEAYDIFLLNYPESEHREKAMLRLIQANLATFKGPKFDATGLIDANERIKDFEQEFPVAAERIGSQAIKVRAEESLALKALHTAEWFDKRKKRISAITMYNRVVEEYPQTAAAQQAIDRLRELGQPVGLPAGAQVDAPPVAEPTDGQPVEAPASADVVEPTPVPAPDAAPSPATIDDGEAEILPAQ